MSFRTLALLVALVAILAAGVSPVHGHCLAYEFVKLVASDGDGSDQFGYSVALSGSSALVGAHQDEENGGYSGSAYIFQLSGIDWVEEAKLTASDGAADDYFGNAVAIHGETVVLGAKFDDDGGSKSGSAYVFVEPGEGWGDMTETAKLTASDGASNDNFGYAVAVFGDVVVVGAKGDDTGRGAVYVFEKPVSGWVDATETARLTAFDRLDFDNFGWSVAIFGETVLVGSKGDDAGRGSVYVFEEPVTGWVDATETAKLTASDRAERDFFGYSVAISGATVIVGAYFDDDNDATDSGSVYVFEKPITGWEDATEDGKLTASDAAADDNFGVAVATTGDMVLVGAYYDDDHGSSSGSAYAFRRDGASWVEEVKLTASDAYAYDLFGGSVALSDGVAMAGAYKDDDAGSMSGGVYMFHGMTNDCNGDGMPDVCEGDCNENGILDGCDLAAGTSEDCNLNGVLDECDIADGTSPDVNANEIPDDCEDCNDNGILDEDDIAGGTSDDCNGNDLPDECEMLLVQSDPPPNSVDAGQPHAIDGSAHEYGWDMVAMVFDLCTGTVEPGDFVVTEHGGDGEPPVIDQVDAIDSNSVLVTLNEPLEPGTWTMFAHEISGQTLCLGFLPADVDQDGAADMADLDHLMDCVNGEVDPPCEPWQMDLNHSDEANAQDVLRFIDLLNGADTFDPWMDHSIGASPCLP